jgi:uncharacterized membrane protein YkvA (DUF1232 family)
MAGSKWRDRTRELKREARALYFAVRDPRVPWYAKVCAGLVVAYIFSPIDPIPDFIPILGHLDELVIVPIAVIAIRRMIPAGVFAECRARAEALDKKPISRVGVVVVLALWLAIAAVSVWLALRWLG